MGMTRLLSGKALRMNIPAGLTRWRRCPPRYPRAEDKVPGPPAFGLRPRSNQRPLNAPRPLKEWLRRDPAEDPAAKPVFFAVSARFRLYFRSAPAAEPYLQGRT